MERILVANRGEIAIRIMRAARQMGRETVSVYAGDDASSLHVGYANQACELPGNGAAAYLDAQALVDVARSTGCTAVHPGYGFLSENADFARLCSAEGIRFIGPAPELLDLFGSKVRALELAREAGVPVMPGTSEPTSLEAARAFAQEHGAVMLKAMAGGGGRGMRAVRDIAELDEAFERCRSEAQQAFGNGDLYVEKLLLDARHIEVQVVGDGSGHASGATRNCWRSPPARYWTAPYGRRSWMRPCDWLPTSTTTTSAPLNSWCPATASGSWKPTPACRWNIQ